MPFASGVVNPFSTDVCTGPYGVSESSSIKALNLEVLERLTQAVDDQQRQAGQVGGQPLVLLTAPRAGYGKTHLLGRMTAAGGGQWLILPLAFRMGDEVTRANLARRGLEALERAEVTVDGWSKLREASAGVTAGLLRQLIQAGKLPCANPEQAVRVLSGPAHEIFQPGGPAHVIGDWLRKHLTQLRRPMAELASRATGVVTPSDAEGWIQCLVVQALDGGGSGLAALRQLAAQSEEGCGTLLKLLGLWRPVVILVDHLDGFYRNADAGLRIATLLLDLAEMDGHPVVLSLNQDVWQATFGHHLPSALEDRLTASRLLLRGLSEEEAVELVTMRLQQAGVEARLARAFEDFLDVPRYFMGRPVGSVSARALLRHAAQQWVLFWRSAPHEGLRPGDPQAGQSGEEGAGDEMESGGGLGLLPVIEGKGSPVLDSPFSLSPASLFDDETQEVVRQVSGGLSEPSAALPQDEVVESSILEGGFLLPKGFEVRDVRIPNGLLENEPDGGSSTDPREKAGPGATDAAVGEGPTPSASSLPGAPSGAITGGQGRVQGSFEKLREMLDRLRQSNGMSRPSGSPPSALRAAVKEGGLATAADTGDGRNQEEPSNESVARAALMGRFEALKLQMSGEAETRALDGSRVMELIRLAGRRFPLVRSTEHELPGVAGRSVMGWTLSGSEILFAPVGASDPSFWRALAVFAAGRLAAAEETASRVGDKAPAFKVVVFKSLHENASWGGLFSSPQFPEVLKPWVDVVHLDGRSIASLYAMQRIIREAELGTLQAAPQQVMSVLARELDFFWKRITRPRGSK